MPRLTILTFGRFAGFGCLTPKSPSARNTFEGFIAKIKQVVPFTVTGTRRHLPVIRRVPKGIIPFQFIEFAPFWGLSAVAALAQKPALVVRWAKSPHSAPLEREKSNILVAVSRFPSVQSEPQFDRGTGGANLRGRRIGFGIPIEVQVHKRRGNHKVYQHAYSSTNAPILASVAKSNGAFQPCGICYIIPQTCSDRDRPQGECSLHLALQSLWFPSAWLRYHTAPPSESARSIDGSA
ncbi:hypothetical protein GGE07_004031 [Sinorhizobium terangae]|nr:hypothetical protein [Sinorhizobium terangae]